MVTEVQSHGRFKKKWQNHDRLTVPEEADDSTCLEGVKFQGDLWPDLGAVGQLYQLQEAHVEN